MTPPVAGDHTLTLDEVSPLSLVRRWSCTRCGRVVMGCAGRFWGPAVDEVCGRKAAEPSAWSLRFMSEAPPGSNYIPSGRSIIALNTPPDPTPFPRFRPFRWLP